MAIDLKASPVKTIQAIAGADPDKTATILSYERNPIIR